MTYSNFKEWVEASRSLHGFNLTETLLQQFFAYLDPHKKGFLSENDWENAFKGLDFEKQKLNEVLKAISFHFKTPTQAFLYFKKQKNTEISDQNIDFHEFFTGINGILPSRFQENDVKSLYRILLSTDNELLTYKTFESLLWKPQTTVSSQDFFGKSLFKPFSSNKNENFLAQKTETPLIKPLESIRMKFKTSNKDFEVEILKRDPTQSGFIPNIELKNLLKDLKIGLESSEINEIMNLFQTNAGLFDWKRFLRTLQKTPIETSIFSRTVKKLESLSRKISDYLLSAKDAFRQFNVDNSGKMNFEEFSKLVLALYKKDEEPSPAFDIIKDLFEFIDLRKDGHLDIHEWMQTFRNIQKKSDKNSLDKNQMEKNQMEKYSMDKNSMDKNSMDKNPIETNSIEKNSKEKNSIEKNSMGKSSFGKSLMGKSLIGRNLKEKSPLQWEDSLEYDQVIENIVRNRRRLQELLDENGVDGKISKEKACEIMKTTLKIESLPEEVLGKMLKFSQKEDGLINIKFLMEVLKDRTMSWTSPPKNFKSSKLSEQISKSLTGKSLNRSKEILEN